MNEKTILTPGPWYSFQALENNAPSYFAITNGWGTHTIAKCHNEANARLIMAAPDLLKALEIAVVTIKRLAKTDSANGTLDVARNAIAKARGTA